MLEAFVCGERGSDADDSLVLTFAERQKSRHRCVTEQGRELGWFIERGQVLQDGDVLVCNSGEKVRVVSAPEAVSVVASDDVLLLARAAYHLGNRHVPLQIGLGFLSYQHDHVLDDMVLGLGLTVNFQRLPFQPENGAYHGKANHNHIHHHDGHHHH